MSLEPKNYTHRKKLIELSTLLEKIEKLRTDDKIIVFTNGCFDILHKGHIYYLRQSRMLGDLLIIGLNSDSSIKKIKGEHRPVNSEQDRAYLLEALDFVDYIVIFDENTPLNLVQQIQPNIYTKGGDYSMRNVLGPGLGSDIVESYGGRVVLIEYVDGYSTTELIEK